LEISVTKDQMYNRELSPKILFLVLDYLIRVRTWVINQKNILMEENLRKY
jgi:hypothetical protein